MKSQNKENYGGTGKHINAISKLLNQGNKNSKTKKK